MRELLEILLRKQGLLDSLTGYLSSLTVFHAFVIDCDGTKAIQSEVYYLQSQNGNLYTSSGGEDMSNEYEALRPDVPRDVSWATDALGMLCMLLPFAVPNQELLRYIPRRGEHLDRG